MRPPDEARETVNSGARRHVGWRRSATVAGQGDKKCGANLEAGAQNWVSRHEHMARAEKGRMLSPATRSILRLLLLTFVRTIEMRKAEWTDDHTRPM